MARSWLLTLHLSKTKKLLKTMKFPKEYDQHVDIKKVNLEVMRGWVAKRVTALLGVEDEVVIAYVIEQLELPPTEVWRWLKGTTWRTTRTHRKSLMRA